jgi:hypothetical protein
MSPLHQHAGDTAATRERYSGSSEIFVESLKRDAD